MSEKDSRLRLGEEWGDLKEKDEVPTQGEGATADRVARDQERTRPRFATEDRRVSRKVTITFNKETGPAIVERLRDICRAEGHADGALVSPVLEDLILVGIDAYEAGELEPVEETAETRKHLRRRPERKRKR